MSVTDISVCVCVCPQVENQWQTLHCYPIVPYGCPRLPKVTKGQLDRMVDRVKPWFMVHGSWFCSWFCLWFCSWFDEWFGSWFCSWFMVHSNILVCKGLLPQLCTPFTFTQAHWMCVSLCSSWTWWTTLCSSLWCPPWLGTPSWPSGVLGASAWTM